MSKRGIFVVFCLVLLFAGIASGVKDPELEQCKSQCGKQRQYDPEQVQDCRDKCERYYKEKQRREREEEKGRHGGDSNPEDPFRRLAECQGQCVQKQDEGERRHCQQVCFEKFQKERERQEREREEREGGRGGGGVVYLNPKEDPFQRRRECEGKCVQKQDERERRHCQQQCREEFEREQEREREKERQHGRGGRGENPRDPEEERRVRECKAKCREEHERREHQEKCEYKCTSQQKERGEDTNPRREGEEREEQPEKVQEGEPYVFHDQHFSAQLQSDHGRIRILQRFNERSELLRGIKNFRVAIFEANPRTFVVPNHWDADTIIFVHQGKGTISLVRQEKRESFNIRRGDVVRVLAGTTVYIVNSDNNEKLIMVKLIHPVSTPGKFEAFFGPGGENPESYFKAFSSEILEAAFNVKRDKFERVFSQQREGPIIKASEEQIRGMSHHEEGGIWPFGGESKGSFNLFEQRPSQSNQYGKLFEVGPNKFRELQEIDVGVSFANISKGSMTAPMFNSRATKIGIILEGEGYLEISCPHVSSSEFKHGQERQKGSGSRQQSQFTPSYQRVSAKIRRGTVFVVPAGHPFVTVASQNENMQGVCFEVKAQNNEKVQLAGRRNIFTHFESEAKRLGFGVSEKEVDGVFKSQEDEFFLRGPRQQHEGRAYA